MDMGTTVFCALDEWMMEEENMVKISRDAIAFMRFASESPRESPRARISLQVYKIISGHQERLEESSAFIDFGCVKTSDNHHILSGDSSQSS